MSKFYSKRNLRLPPRFFRNRIAVQTYIFKNLKILFWKIFRKISAKIPDFALLELLARSMSFFLKNLDANRKFRLLQKFFLSLISKMLEQQI